MRTVRLLALGWLFQFKLISRSAFDSTLAVAWPLFFATVAFFMFRIGHDPKTLVYASLGSAVMGVWTATSVTAGTALARQRWQGTLELLAAAPTHFALILLPMTLATSAIGLYCIASTLLWGWLVFGIALHIVHPLLFGVSILATIVAVGMLGFLIAVLFVRHRSAWVLGAASEYPVWLVCGFLVPLSLLPGWVRPISWALAPTWGMRAIRESAVGGTPLPDALVCLGLGAAYVLIGVLALDHLLRAARRRAALSLT